MTLYIGDNWRHTQNRTEQRAVPTAPVGSDSTAGVVGSFLDVVAAAAAAAAVDMVLGHCN